MTPEQWQQVKELFAAALEEPPAERELFVWSRAGADVEVAAEVDALLSRAGALGSFLEPEALPGWTEDSLPAGTRVGAYTIVSLLGRGGMGVVYLAEQENPRRRVALKVMRAQPLSHMAARRFAHEAQLLARLEHPGIARIFEAGAQAGPHAPQPWFAMELVDGLALDEYCAKNSADVRARLALFGQVCDAVQHAHERGVIHRDLKPANILVGARGEVKVLDFGVARAIDPDLKLTTLLTDPGLLVGTLAYMSPEQASGDSRAIDQRSDVYALGVVLYEILAGRLPCAIDGLSVPAALRAILEDEPARVSSSDKRLRGDLDTIVSKSLEKDRARRYASAGELSADIRRFLSDQPIGARPASTVYQLGKFARRNKVLVGGVAAVIVVLALGVVATTWQAVQASEGRAVAQREARRAKEILTFLKKMLATIDPDVAQGRDTTVVREMLDQASRDVETAPPSDPDVEAELRATIGELYLTLGLYRQAEPHYARAAELNRIVAQGESAAVAIDLSKLALNLRYQARLDESEEKEREALAMRRRLFGENHEAVAVSLNNLGELLFIKGQRARSLPEHESA